MKRKLIAALVSMVLLFTATVAFAGGQGGEATEGAGKPIEVTMMIRDRSSINWEGSPLQQDIADRFGILIKGEVVDYSAFAEKFKIRFNSGDIPDFSNFHGLSVEELNEAGDRGMLLNILDYLDQMPDLKKHMVKFQGDLRYYASNEKAIYFTPFTFPFVYGYVGIAARTDLLDKAGFDYKNLKDFDDLYDMFEVLQQQNGGKPPLSSRYGYGSIASFGEYMGIARNPWWWNAKKEQWEGTYYRPGMKDFLTFMASMYKDGLLHPDFLTMQTKERDALMYSGDSTAFIDNLAYLGHVMNNRASEDFVWSHVIPPTYEGERFATPSLKNLNTGQGKIVSARTKAPEQIMQFLNWLYTEEGMLRTQYGVAGENYIDLGEGKWLITNDANKDKIPARYHSQLVPAEEFLKRQDQLPFNMYGFYAYSNAWRVYSRPINPEGVNLHEISFNAYTAAGVYRTADPGTPFSPEELEELKMIREPIQTYADETITKMILGQLSISDTWDGFQARLKELKYDRLIELYKASYETFNANTVDIR